MEGLPESDVCLMMGSLYHFYPDLKQLFEKIRRSSRRFILSEPVVNLTNQKGLIGKLAQKLTNAGKGEETFRFDENSLLETIKSWQKDYDFDYQIMGRGKDEIIEIRW
jgi:hypothetical protein